MNIVKNGVAKRRNLSAAPASERLFIRERVKLTLSNIIIEDF